MCQAISFIGSIPPIKTAPADFEFYQRTTYRQLGVFAQDHILPSQSFFKPIITQIQFSYSLLEIRVFLLEINGFICAGFANSVPSQSSFTSFLKLLTPTVIEIIVNPFLATEFSD
jgi:hypothetical protein